MTGWEGERIKEFRDVAQDAFGRKGLDSSSLIHFSSNHLPAELSEGLTRDSAESIAARLRDVGGVLEVARTAQLTGLRHRAADVWATQCNGAFTFTEIDGLIILLSALNARGNVECLKSRNPDSPVWEIERALNHFHPAPIDPPKKAIEKESLSADSLEAALRGSFPDRAFTIVHSPTHSVSFWQTATDSPKDSCRAVESKEQDGQIYCDCCRHVSCFSRTDFVHPDFPHAEWGKCDSCGGEVLVRGCEKLRFIEPAKS